MTGEKDARGIDLDIADAIDGHQKFREQFERDKAFYARLAKGQKPKLLWIGCSDSRGDGRSHGLRSDDRKLASASGFGWSYQTTYVLTYAWYYNNRRHI